MFLYHVPRRCSATLRKLNFSKKTIQRQIYTLVLITLIATAIFGLLDYFVSGEKCIA